MLGTKIVVLAIYMIKLDVYQKFIDWLMDNSYNSDGRGKGPVSFLIGTKVLFKTFNKMRIDWYSLTLRKALSSEE